MCLLGQFGFYALNPSSDLPLVMLQLFSDANSKILATVGNHDGPTANKQAKEVQAMILKHYFTTTDAIGCVFAGVYVKILPIAMEWVGRDKDGFLAMFNPI